MSRSYTSYLPPLHLRCVVGLLYPCRYSLLVRETRVPGFRLTVGLSDRLCGLVVSVGDYKHRGPGFGSRALLRIFLRELGLERGPLSLVIG
jgi:hypothetical protein